VSEPYEEEARKDAAPSPKQVPAPAPATEKAGAPGPPMDSPAKPSELPEGLPGEPQEDSDLEKTKKKQDVLIRSARFRQTATQNGGRADKEAHVSDDDEADVRDVADDDVVDTKTSDSWADADVPSGELATKLPTGKSELSADKAAIQFKASVERDPRVAQLLADLDGAKGWGLYGLLPRVAQCTDQEVHAKARGMLDNVPSNKRRMVLQRTYERLCGRR
jgi:hypothetical protein